MKLQKNNFFLLLAICAAGIFSGCAKAPQYVIVDETLAPIEQALVKDGFEPAVTKEGIMSGDDGTKSKVDSSSNRNIIGYYVDLPPGTNYFFKERKTASGAVARVYQNYNFAPGMHAGGGTSSGQHSFSMGSMSGENWNRAKEYLVETSKSGNINSLTDTKTLGKGTDEFDLFYNACAASEGDFAVGSDEDENHCITIRGKAGKECDKKDYKQLTCKIKNDTFVIEARTQSRTYDEIYYIVGLGIDQKNSVISNTPQAKETMTASEGKSYEKYIKFVFYKK